MHQILLELLIVFFFRTNIIGNFNPPECESEYWAEDHSKILHTVLLKAWNNEQRTIPQFYIPYTPQSLEFCAEDHSKILSSQNMKKCTFFLLPSQKNYRRFSRFWVIWGLGCNQNASSKKVVRKAFLFCCSYIFSKLYPSIFMKDQKVFLLHICILLKVLWVFCKKVSMPKCFPLDILQVFWSKFTAKKRKQSSQMEFFTRLDDESLLGFPTKTKLFNRKRNIIYWKN